MSLKARGKCSRHSSGETYVRSEMASNNPGFFGFILWNRQQYFVCIFGFFSRCNLRLRLQLIVSVEISLHQKNLTLEQWEKRSLSGQIFFQLRLPKGDIHHYDLSISPDKCPRRVNRNVVETMVNTYHKVFGGQRPVFDGRKKPYSGKALPIGRKPVSVNCRNLQLFCYASWWS